MIDLSGFHLRFGAWGSLTFSPQPVSLCATAHQRGACIEGVSIRKLAPLYDGAKQNMRASMLVTVSQALTYHGTHPCPYHTPIRSA